MVSNSERGDENEEVQLGRVRHREPRIVSGQPRDIDVRRYVLDELIRRMKVEVADFCGKLNPSAFFYWVTSLEDYFDWFLVPEDCKWLKLDIRKDMLTARLYNVEEAYQLALQLERQISGNSHSFYSIDSRNFSFPTSTNTKSSVETKENVSGNVRGKERAFGEGP
ncbi:hypothetical protein LWI29_012798 [Acer saccharum]|uniref:Uncharacterized protein n=1 Tax=Acer saccharum TaxID=4024 RepID=A0AA39VAZ0_ACESA|nr:hypothetical protein LWI29_012798 [Acer saccharum]